MKVIQNLVAQSNYTNKCPYAMNAESLVVHNTANDATARNEVAYMIRNANKVSFHYAVDDKEIVQGIPENRNAFHAGDGVNGPGNRKGIAVEICYSKSGGTRFTNAEKRAAKFIAFKLKQKGWGINKVTKHQDYANKYCPHRTLDMGWQRFLNMVQAELNSLNKPRDYMQNGDTGSEVKKLQEDLLYLGYNIGSYGADGVYGNDTANAIRRLQESHGLTADRIAGKETLAKIKELVKNKEEREMAEKLNKPSTWAIEQWERMVRQGHFDDTRAQANMTRQEGASVLDGLLFNDNQSSWHKEDIEKAIELGITDGSNMGGLATREQVVSMLIRSMLTKEDVIKIIENYLEEEKENGEDKLEEETI